MKNKSLLTILLAEVVMLSACGSVADSGASSLSDSVNSTTSTSSTSTSSTSSDSASSTSSTSSDSTSSDSASSTSSTSSETEVSDTPDDYSTFSSSLSATDRLGRSFDSYTTADEEKQVGLFYFIWAGQHEGCNYDISKLSSDKLMNDKTTVGKFHYWTKPLYDYYDSGDAWVFRKHLELFVAAGVDYLMFDVTNAYTYDTVLNNLLPVALEMYEAGWNVPKLAFYTYSSSKNTVEHLYATFFDPATENGQKYAPLWYRWKDTGGKNADGKPWIAARTQTNDAQDYENCSDEIKSFFYLKAAQWPFGTMYANGMPWMSWADSSTGYAQYNHSGIMSVSVAQHTAGAFSDSVFLNNRNLNQGRGWTRTTQTNDSTAVASGANFQDQWNYVFSQGDKVNNVFVTGWNEWVAQKQAPAGSRTSCYFVDLFNEEFSRDIEMTADENGYADNFYLQLAENIRKFKGVDDRHGAAEKVASIDINSGESAWVGTEKYYDVSGDTLPRNYQSANNLILRNYTNKTGRNDIVKLRMAHDESKLYLYIECASDITAYNGTDKNWMNVLLSVDGQTGGWENYQYVVNRSFVSSGDKSVALIDRLSADGSGETIGQGEMNIDGKVMKIALPLSVLGIGSGEFTLRFKVADNVTNYNDIMNYYVNGDAAPIGRLNYVYSGK